LTADLKRKLTIGFGLGIVVFIGLILYGDIREIGRLLQDFRWNLLPAILGLTMFNYILRGVRFHYYLGQIGIRNIPFWTSFRVFIGGFSLTLTPGKFGELVRVLVLWLKNLVKANPARVAPATIVDRIIDGLAMAILAAIGVLAYSQYWRMVAPILAVLIAGIIIIQIRPLALWFLNIGEKLPLMARFVRHMHLLYENTYELLRFKNLLIGLAIGLVSWSAEGVAFYLTLIGLGVAGSFNLVLLSIFTLAVGSILGGASSSPGGLGAAEVSIAGILQTLVNLSETMAATATILIRFFTLWFAVILGILTVIIWRKMLFKP
jgi:uncharacterized protein (TIRG00374 family)